MGNLRGMSERHIICGWNILSVCWWYRSLGSFVHGNWWKKSGAHEGCHDFGHESVRGLVLWWHAQWSTIVDLGTCFRCVIMASFFVVKKTWMQMDVSSFIVIVSSSLTTNFFLSKSSSAETSALSLPGLWWFFGSLIPWLAFGARRLRISNRISKTSTNLRPKKSDHHIRGLSVPPPGIPGSVVCWTNVRETQPGDKLARARRLVEKCSEEVLGWLLLEAWRFQCYGNWDCWNCARNSWALLRSKTIPPLKFQNHWVCWFCGGFLMFFGCCEGMRCLFLRVLQYS